MDVGRRHHARSVFPLAVESSVIWTISREMSSLLAVEATARGKFVLRLGRTKTPSSAVLVNLVENVMINHP